MLKGLRKMELKTGYLRLEKGRVEGFEESQEIPLSTDITVIGRAPPYGDPDAEVPDVKIRDDYISRSHIRIYYSYDGERFFAQERDTGTKNGTFINGEEIEPGKPHALKDGDFLGLAKVSGEFRVVFRFRESIATLNEQAIPERAPIGGLIVDQRARRVWVDGKEVALRRKEFDLLAFLYENRGRACSKDEIAEKVWADERGIVSQETIDTDIYRIREGIEPEPSSPRYLITLPRYGYRLDL